jgi:hypothetical protein
MRREILAVPVLLAMAGCGSPTSSTLVPSPTPPPPNVAGSYSGTYTITACGNTGDFQSGGFCKAFAVGTLLPVSLTLTQTGANLSGSLVEGQALTPVTGSVDGSGRITLNGSTSFEGITAQLVGWDTTVSGTGMVGSWNTVWSSSILSGGAQTVQTMDGVSKTAGLPQRVASARADRPFSSFLEVFDAMTR